MMKFAIFREFVNQDGKKRRKVLAEMDQEAIIQSFLVKFPEVSEDRFRYIFQTVIDDFKQESLKIP